MRRIIAILIVFVIVILSVNPILAAPSGDSYPTTNVNVAVNGKSISFERQPVLINNRVLLPARTALQNLGANVEWYPDSRRITITSGNTVVGMKIGEASIIINNTNYDMDVEPVLVDGTVMVPIRFVAEALKTNLTWDGTSNTINLGQNSTAADTSRGSDRKGYVVVIDPGHGGSETGEIFAGVDEKDLNIDIAKRLNTLLQAEGVTTYMTRTDDSYVDLYSRSGLANNVKADLLISIHNNASGDGKASDVSGSMALYYPGKTSPNGNLSGQDFASIVENVLTSTLGTKNLGTIARPNLAVLRTSNMPAVIAEVGFMTNWDEFGRLQTASFRQQAAGALENAVMIALKKIR